MTEIKLKQTLKLSFNGVVKEVHTLSIDDDKMGKTSVALKVGNIFSDAVFKMTSKMPQNIQDSKESMIILDENGVPEKQDPKALGTVIVGNLSEDNIKFVINTFCNLGCIYHENENDLNKKTITEEFDIQDIDYIIGYYTVNFTLKRFMG